MMLTASNGRFTQLKEKPSVAGLPCMTRCPGDACDGRLRWRRGRGLCRRLVECDDGCRHNREGLGADLASVVLRACGGGVVVVRGCI